MDVNDNPFIKNRSSTRVTNAPGGNSTLSFGNYISEENEKLRVRNGHTGSQMTPSTEAAGNTDAKKMSNQSDRKTNVKVNQPPGGASSSKYKNNEKSVATYLEALKQLPFIIFIAIYNIHL